MVGQKRVGHICCQLCSRQCAPVFAAVAAQLCRITFLMDASLINRPQPWLSGTPCRRQRRARCRPAALFDDPSSSSNGAGSNPAPPQQQGSRILNPIFPEPQRAAAKPLPVQTQRGVPTFKPSIADPPCLLCSGSGNQLSGAQLLAAVAAAERERAGTAGDAPLGEWEVLRVKDVDAGG